MFKRKREVAMPEQLEDSSNVSHAIQAAESGIEQSAEPTHESSVEQKCPKCSSQMLRRVAVYGIEAGNQFWGCSRFPACTGVRWS